MSTKCQGLRITPGKSPRPCGRRLPPELLHEAIATVEDAWPVRHVCDACLAQRLRPDPPYIPTRAQ